MIYDEISDTTIYESKFSFFPFSCLVDGGLYLYPHTLHVHPGSNLVGLRFGSLILQPGQSMPSIRFRSFNASRWSLKSSPISLIIIFSLLPKPEHSTESVEALLCGCRYYFTCILMVDGHASVTSNLL